MTLQDHQRRVLGQTVGQIDLYRTGAISAVDALNHIWGIYEAAEVARTPEGGEFVALYYSATAADDARQPYMPPGTGTDAAFEATLDALRDWAGQLQRSDPDLA